MKLVVDDNRIVLFLNKLYIKSLDFMDKNCVERYLRQFLLKLKNIYGLEFDGYYNTTLFIDSNYGVVIEMVKEEFGYLDYFSNQIELDMKVVESSFLYEISDMNLFICDNLSIYCFKDKLYLKVENEISDVLMGSVLEESNRVCYGEEALSILKKAKLVR